MAESGTPDRYLAGRVALVTGATRGVGRATAARLHAAGAYVYLNYAHDDANAAATLAALDAVGGPGGAGLARGDVTAPDTLPALVERIGAERGRLDVFVHNVASLHPMQATAPDPPGVHADLAMALDPLLYGIGGLTKLLPPTGGRIVAVSSLGGRAVIPRYVGLGVAKAALESLVRYLAVELAGRGVTVNAVASAKLDKGEPLAPHEQALAGRAPAGRLATPDDLAGVVALLCRAEAGGIHGQVITVDGGLSLRAP